MRIGVLAKKAAVGVALTGVSLAFYGVARAETKIDVSSESAVTMESSSSVQVDNASTTVSHDSGHDNDNTVAESSAKAEGAAGAEVLILSDSKHNSAGQIEKSPSEPLSTLGSGGNNGTENTAARTESDHGAIVPATVLLPPAIGQVMRRIEAKDRADAGASRPQAAVRSSESGSASTNSHQSPVPAPESAPAGALQALSRTLATIVVPATSILSILEYGNANLPLAASGLAAAGWLILVLGLMSLFVDRLRLSGFSHAARSDVADSNFSFATPKMGFAWSFLAARQNPFLINAGRTLYERR